jgi:peroxiredoxin
VLLGTIALVAWGLLTPATIPATHGVRQGTPLPAAPQAGHWAPDATLIDLNGHPLRLSSLRGQIVILNFWYVACEPCRYEMPGFERVYHADRAQGLVVLGVNPVDDVPTIEGFVHELGIDYPVVRDAGQQAILAYQVTATPSSFFIDRQGVVRYTYTGAIDATTLRQYVGALLT